jgi:predicted TPR repeat methyltransferase
MLPISIEYQVKPNVRQLEKLYQMSNLFLRQNDWSRGACYLYYITQYLPQFLQAKFELGICQMQCENWAGAIKSLESILNEKYNDPNLICNLAISHWQQKNYKSALRLFKYNRFHFPHHIDTQQNLAAFYVQFQRFEQAIQLYQNILRFNPELSDIRFNLAALLQQRRIYDEAIMHYQIILQHHPKHHQTLYNLGCIYYHLKDNKACHFYWQHYLSLNPSHKAVCFMLQHLKNELINPCDHQAYVEELFDHYANHYEKHVVHQLEYQLPTFLKHYMNTHFNGMMFENILDIGCGTGLCGTSLHPFTSELIGIDISEKMVQQAVKKNIYQKLYTVECEEFLQEHLQQFKLIVAMDVTPYIININSWLTIIYEALTPNGQLIFSIEVNHSDKSDLEASGRISHPIELILKSCERLGFNIIYQQQLMARLQDNQPVNEHLFHLKRC